MAETKPTATQLGRDAADKVREQVATNEFAQRAKEAAYTLVGLSVMGAQRATQAAKQLRTNDTSNLDVRAKTKDATEAARRQFTKVDDVLAGALARIEDAMAPLEDRLPTAAKETVQKARVTGKGIHEQIRSRVTTEAPATEAPTEALTAPKSRSRSEKADRSDAA